MRKILITLAILLMVTLAGNPRERIKQIQEDIRLLNLINGLELTKDQMIFILRQAKEAQKIKEECENKLKEYEDVIIEVFKELRKNRMTDEEIDEALRVKIGRAEDKLKNLKHEMDEGLGELGEQIKQKLEGQQIYQLERYVPCLILPPDESKIGQNENATGLEKMFEKIRELPEEIYQKRKDEIAAHSASRMREHLPKGYIINEEKEKEEILSILDEVRALSDIDFELKKTELVTKLKSKGTPPKLPMDVSTNIEEFLLNPSIIPLLEEKLEKKSVVCPP